MANIFLKLMLYCIAVGPCPNLFTTRLKDLPENNLFSIYPMPDISFQVGQRDGGRLKVLPLVLPLITELLGDKLYT